MNKFIAGLTALFLAITPAASQVIPIGGGGGGSGTAIVTGNTWTPTMYGSTTPGTTTYNTQVGDWRKVCSSTTCTLTLNGYIRATQGGTAAGNVIIGGLPEALPDNVYSASCTIGYMQGWTFAGGTQLMVHGVQNTSTMELMYGGTGISQASMPVTGWAGNAIVQFSCTINY